MTWPTFMRDHLRMGLAFVCRVGLGCLFLYSALPKIRQPYDFLHDVYNYQIVGPNLGLLTAMALPCMELVVGVCLLGGVFVGGALLASIGMAGMFTFVIGWAMYQGLDISCGCFGSGAEKITYMTLIRAMGVGAVSAMGFWLHISVARQRVGLAGQSAQVVADPAGAVVMGTLCPSHLQELRHDGCGIEGDRV